MKEYTITVNGKVYQVTVEEGLTQGAPAAAVSAPIPAPASVPAPAAAPAAAAAPVDGVPVKASVPGKIVSISASEGTSVASGDTILILEAMKMEIPVVAPQAGTVRKILVSQGAAVESGDILATIS